MGIRRRTEGINSSILFEEGNKSVGWGREAQPIKFFDRRGNRLSRPAMDAPSAITAESKEKQGLTWKPLSLEVQLWVEVSLLIAFGFIMIYSASSIPALTKFSDPNHYLKRQLFCVVLGIPIIYLVSRTSYRSYKKYTGLMLIGMIVLLLLVLIPGVGAKYNNARRWFGIGSFHVQPAEFAKVVLGSIFELRVGQEAGPHQGLAR